MSGKRSIRELERQCKKEPDNLVARLLLAAAYREAGRTGEAVPLYRSVASAYQRQGRKTQAVAVLRSLLEIDPADGESRTLMHQFDDEPPAATPPSAPPGAGQPPGAPAAPGATAAPPGATALSATAAPESGRQTIPSLDGHRLRATGQALSARVLSADVPPRELTPVRPPGVPATVRPTSPPTGGGASGAAEPSPSSTLTGLGLAGPGARAPTPGRGSSALYTPTPLPAPMPFHEADHTGHPERSSAPAGFDEDDAATRIADAFRTGRGAAIATPAAATPAPSSPPRAAPARPAPPPPARPAAPPPPARPPAPPPARPPVATARTVTPATGRPVTQPASPTARLAQRRPPTVPPPMSAPSPALTPRRPPTSPPPPAVASRVTRRTTTDADTRDDLDVAAELDTRRVRRLSDHELDVLSGPVPGSTGLVDRIDTAELDGETNPEAVPAGVHRTRPSSTAPSPPPAFTAPITRPLPAQRGATGPTAATPAKAAKAPTAPTAATIDDEPTRPPATPGAPQRPTDELEPPTRVSAEPGASARGDTGGGDTGDGDAGDELTRVAPDTHPTPRATPWPHGGLEEATDPRGDAGARARISKPGMHRSRAFPATFSDTLGEMDPDGAAIETPLDIFSMLPPEAMAELERRMVLRRFAPGELVVREGDPGNACYVIVDGEVRVLKQDPLHPDDGPTEVARLGAGSLFGEFALLADRRRHATVQSTTHTDLYEIPRQLLRELAASYPGVGPALESFYRQRLLATLLRTAPFFAPLPEDKRAELLARFVPVRAESGEIVVHEGQPAGGLYLIVIGAVEITKRLGRHRSVILTTLREGAYFGEMSLLSGDPTTATVVAAGRVELALLPPRDFYEVVAEHPQLWAHIRREAKTRSLEMARILAGETGAV